jgi:hypothetical protein
MAVEAVGELEVGGPAAAAAEGSGGPAARAAPVRSWCGAYAVAAERFAPGVVGAKSLNLLALRVRRAALGRHSVPSGHAL